MNSFRMHILLCCDYYVTYRCQYIHGMMSIQNKKQRNLWQKGIKCWSVSRSTLVLHNKATWVGSLFHRISSIRLCHSFGKSVPVQTNKTTNFLCFDSGPKSNHISYSYTANSWDAIRMVAKIMKCKKKYGERNRLKIPYRKVFVVRCPTKVSTFAL